jgi:hypothetical protein
MVSNEEIESYISKVPKLPDALKESIKYLSEGDLTKAALEADKDIALKKYLITLVNKPIYGFKANVKDIKQIFGILGVNEAYQVIYNYMLSLLTPGNFELFKLNKTTFNDLQDSLTVEWNKILSSKKINDKNIQNAIILLPASILVCEALFKNHIDEVELLKNSNQIDYSTILKRLCGIDLFDICAKISDFWELGDKTKELVLVSSGTRDNNDEDIKYLGAMMHLLLFHQLSKAEYIEAGLNDFIVFNVEYAQSAYEEFMNIMEIE